MKTAVKIDRLTVANAVLKTFAAGFEIVHEPGKGYCLAWMESRGRVVKRWMCDRGSFFPSCHRSVPTGGTHITAISQLIRYCQGKPYLPLTTWKYWAGNTVRLWKDDAERDAGLRILEDSDYQKTPECVFCGRDLTGQSWDWFSTIDGIEGCGHWGRKCQR